MDELSKYIQLSPTEPVVQVVQIDSTLNNFRDRIGRLKLNDVIARGSISGTRLVYNKAYEIELSKEASSFLSFG